MNKEVYGIIYMVKNMISGEVYVGQTIYDFYTRYHNNIEKYTHNDRLKNDMAKLGINNFLIIPQIDVAYSKEELDEKEIFYIELYDSFYNGYNETKGGESLGRGGDNPYAKKIVCLNTNEVFNSLTEASEKYNINKDSLSQHLNKKTKSAGGKKFLFLDEFLTKTNEEINQFLNEPFGNKAMSEARSGSNNPLARAIVCLNTGKKFDTVTQASEKYGILKQAITAHLKGKRKSCGKHPITGEKLIFMYYDEYLKEMDK